VPTFAKQLKRDEDLIAKGGNLSVDPRTKSDAFNQGNKEVCMTKLTNGILKQATQLSRDQCPSNKQAVDMRLPSDSCKDAQTY
jgi:hypothetical protein